MRKSVAVMLVLVFSVASCLVVAKPAFSSADIAEDTWAAKAPMHQARAGLGVAVVNGKIYAIGGHAESGVVGTNEEYDPATDTWTFKEPMPTPRQLFAVAVYQNKIYCIGGTSDYSQYSDVNEVYDPANNTWTTKTPLPTPTGFVSAVVDNKIYAVGTYYNGGYISTTQIYDTDTNAWSTGAPPPFSINGGGYAAAAVTSGEIAPKRMYVFGITASAVELQYFVLIYDPENDSWTFGADPPTIRYRVAVGVVNDRLYVIGGYTLTYPNLWSDPVDTYYATNEQYTPIGYGTVSPKVSVVSPENKTYASSNVSLAFTVNKPALWVGYSLDGQDNVTITGNTTLSELANGLHNITVYARDEFENTEASETITFSVETPFPTTLVVTASGVAVAIVGAGLLVYFKKRKH